MAKKPSFTERVSKPTPQDEANLLLDMSEDKRLRDLGIDPDGSELDILSELLKRANKLK